MDSRLPRYTRVQVLQVVSILLQPEAAKSCPDEAQIILEQLDQDDIATQLLTGDNCKMLADLEVWTGEADELGNKADSAASVAMSGVERCVEAAENASAKTIEEAGNTTFNGASKAWLKCERRLDAVLKQKNQKMEQFMLGLGEWTKVESPPVEEREGGADNKSG